MAVICFVVPLVPELIFIADLGGIELVFSFLVLYYKPLLLRLQTFIDRAKYEFNICVVAFKGSSIVKPRVFVTQAVFYTCTFVVSGSMVYATAFLLPGLLFNNVLV
ncbi:hypothetical protein [Thalassotalea maritima]|uniref:hypothetical protein n=1 Tax=Thalassotalea maritima TaxID=3242416 RepID=UPI00352819D1